MTSDNKQFEKNKIIKEEPKEIKSPNRIDKNKFKEILVIIDSNEFNYKNMVGKFKYTDIKNLVDNIRNNTISEIDAKKVLNALSKIKKAEIIKYKKRTSGHIKLLNLFNKLLNINLTDKTSGSQENENEKVESRKEENEDEDEDYENENEYKDYENEDEDYENEYEDYDNENKNDDETIDQNETIKNLNDNLDEIIDKSKSFEDQTESLKKLEDLKGNLPYNDYDDKELKSKYFKINSQTGQIVLTKSYLDKYLVIHL